MLKFFKCFSNLSFSAFSKALKSPKSLDIFDIYHLPITIISLVNSISTSLIPLPFLHDTSKYSIPSSPINFYKSSWLTSLDSFKSEKLPTIYIIGFPTEYCLIISK